MILVDNLNIHILHFIVEKRLLGGSRYGKSGKSTEKLGTKLRNTLCPWNWNCPCGLPCPISFGLPFRHVPAVVVLALVDFADCLHHLATQKKERRNSLMFTFLAWGLIWRVLRRVFLVGLILGAVAVLILFGFNLRTLIMVGVMLLGIRFILRAARL